MIIIDTREKKLEHIESAFQKNGIPYFKHKLDVGDYANTENMKIVVDRKQNLQEVSQNLCSEDSGRFWRELRRAKKDGVHIVFLIEQRGYKNIRDVANWKSAHSNVSGARIIEQMYRCELAYGVEWRFCNKATTWRTICEILGVE